MNRKKVGRSFFTKALDHWRMMRADMNNAHICRKINAGSAAMGVSDDHPVLFFNVSSRLNRLSLNAAFSWIVASALRNDGIPIRFITCRAGLAPCLLAAKEREMPCVACARLSDKLYAGLETSALTFRNDKFLANEVEGLTEENLQSYVYKGVPLGALTLPSLRWILRKHHLDDDADAAPLHRRFIRSAWSVYLQAEEIFTKMEPRALVVFNGQQYPEATMKWAGQQRGIPVFTHEIGLMPMTCIFTDGEATACPIDLPPDFKMTKMRNERLDAYLSGRMKGNFTTAGIQFWPDMQSLSDDFWKMARTFRQIVPVFTNVVFDTSQSHANTVFTDMFDWLDTVKGIIEENADTLFVIRAHPDEVRPGKESRETVSDWVFNHRMTHLPNVLFVGPKEFFSSYEMIRSAKFVMVYNSTIGLEAAIMGSVVLCGGRSRYTQVPTCYFPQNRESFIETARKFLKDDSLSAPAEFQETARRFLYFQFFHTALSMAQFLEPDPVWNGYVKLKPVSSDELSGKRNMNLKVIEEGILEGKPFILPYDADNEEEEEE